MLFGNLTTIVKSMFDKFFFFVALIKFDKVSIFLWSSHFLMSSSLSFKSKLDKRYSSPPVNFSFSTLFFSHISMVKLFSLSKFVSLWYMKSIIFFLIKFFFDLDVFLDLGVFFSDLGFFFM